MSIFIPIPKKGNSKECSNDRTIALISHTSKVMLKILQARLQQYMNHEFPDVQAGFRKGRGTKIMASSPITSWQIDGETMETARDFILGGSKITADGDCSHEIKKVLAPWKKLYDQTRQHIKKQRHYFANKGSSSQGYGFSCGHVWI